MSDSTLGAVLVAPAGTAFEDIWPVAVPGLLRIARAMLAGRDEAEDAVQEVGARAFAAWRTYRGGPEGRRVWLGKICRNVCYTRLRTLKRRANAVGRLGITAVALREGLAPEDAVAILQALRALPPHLLETLVFRHYGGYSNSETAAVLGVSPSAASARYVACIKRLSCALGESEREDR